MPGYELIGKEEKRNLIEIFEKSNGVFFAHGFDKLRKNKFRVRQFEKNPQLGGIRKNSKRSMRSKWTFRRSKSWTMYFIILLYLVYFINLFGIHKKQHKKLITN